MEHIFVNYWWLIFPVGWMIMGAIGSMSHYRHKSEMLKLLKSYADQGKDPPAALLDALKSDEGRDYDRDDYYRGRRYRRYRGRGWWWPVVVFASLAVGLGYAGTHGTFDLSGGNSSPLTAIAVAFGVAATAMAVIGLVRAAFGRKTRDYNDDDHD